MQNLNNVPTVNFQIKWYVDNVEVRYGVHRGMPGNATVLNEESNEGNNSRSITVTVP